MIGENNLIGEMNMINLHKMFVDMLPEFNGTPEENATNVLSTLDCLGYEIVEKSAGDGVEGQLETDQLDMAEQQIMQGILIALQKEYSTFEAEKMLRDAIITTENEITTVTYNNGVIDRFKIINVPTLLHESEW